MHTTQLNDERCVDFVFFFLLSSSWYTRLSTIILIFSSLELLLVLFVSIERRFICTYKIVHNVQAVHFVTVVIRTVAIILAVVFAVICCCECCWCCFCFQMSLEAGKMVYINTNMPTAYSVYKLIHSPKELIPLDCFNVTNATHCTPHTFTIHEYTFFICLFILFQNEFFFILWTVAMPQFESKLKHFELI